MPLQTCMADSASKARVSIWVRVKSLRLWEVNETCEMELSETTRASVPSAPTRCYSRRSSTADIAILGRCKAVSPPRSDARYFCTFLLHPSVVPSKSSTHLWPFQGIQGSGSQGIDQKLRTTAIYLPRPRSRFVSTGKPCILGSQYRYSHYRLCFTSFGR